MQSLLIHEQPAGSPGDWDESSAEAPPSVSLGTLAGYFLRLGSLGFGGPIALAGYMQRDLVPRGWITAEECAQGLAFAQTMPGPLAAQLAMWIGFLRYGVRGTSLVGIVFILPPFLLVVALGTLYAAYNGLPLVQAVFYGIGPAVIAIVALSAVRLARTTVSRDRRLWAIFGVVGAVTVFVRTEVALLFVLAGLLGIVLYAPPAQWRPPAAPLPALVAWPALAAPSASLPLLWALVAFFVVAGAFTFGSGLAIVPFLHEGVVVQHAWLNEQQFRDAVAVGIITPGPVVITAAFVGYLVAGFWGRSSRRWRCSCRSTCLCCSSAGSLSATASTQCCKGSSKAPRPPRGRLPVPPCS